VRSQELLDQVTPRVACRVLKPDYGDARLLGDDEPASGAPTVAQRVRLGGRAHMTIELIAGEDKRK
jgi:hypothetical protein